MCSWFRFPIGFCRVCSLFLGASVMASTLGIPRLTKNWTIPGPLRCIKLSSLVILKPSIHISKTYLKGQVATICFSTAISAPPPPPTFLLFGRFAFHSFYQLPHLWCVFFQTVSCLNYDNSWSADSLLVLGQLQLVHDSINLLAQEASLCFLGLPNEREEKEHLLTLAWGPSVTAWTCSITFMFHLSLF